MSASPAAAIVLENVSKRYQRPRGAPKSTTLKGLLARDLWQAFCAAGKKMLRGRADGPDKQHASARVLQAVPNVFAQDKDALWALQQLSFRLAKGRVTGIIGANGAGKSTLLKLLGRIVRPDLGQVTVVGRVAALIELGAGFHPELTGRENILINGVILGLSRAEVKERMPAIVAFADLGEFMDFPVRTYSSGMYARLGFAVAMHVQPDILLVDEVLSVGDANFTRKCRAALESFRAQGKSIVVVSHDLNTMATWCDEVVWLDKGRLRQKGPAAEVVAAYQKATQPPATLPVMAHA